MLKSVHSGGQTGIDYLGLICAKQCGITTGGFAPKSYRTENGSDYNLKNFGLIEDTSFYYSSRTEKNVITTDATILFGDMNSSGSKETIKYLKKHNKPYKENPTSEEMFNFILDKNIQIINIAGNRGSKLSNEDILKYSTVMIECFKKINSLIQI